jgi:hypothetical protein
MSLWIAGAALVGGVISAKGSKDAAATQAEAATRAGQLQSDTGKYSSDLIQQRFLDTKAGLDPYAQAGLPAIDRQQALLGLRGAEEQQAAQQAAYSGPGFEYQRDRIIGDVNRGASANRQIKSGNRLAALTDRLQGLYASQEGTYFNQLGSQTGVGLGAASALGGVGGNAAAGQANALQQGAIGQANSINQGAAATAGGQLGAAQSYGGAFADIGGAFAYRQQQQEPAAGTGMGGYYSQPGRGW